MDFDYVKIFISISLAVAGWIIGHYFTNKRTVASKQRDLVTEHLVNAYRILALDISNREPSPDRNKKLEDIIADIQLFGSTEQIEMVIEMTKVLPAGGDYDLDPLINNLRNDLRKRLDLNEIAGNVHWAR